MLAEKARFDNAMSGFLYKKSSGAGKWTRRYFILFQVSACLAYILQRITFTNLVYTCTRVSNEHQFSMLSP